MLRVAEAAVPAEDASDLLKRWAVAAAVALAALVGMLILVSLVVVAIQPSQWVATVMAVALPVAAAGLAWLVASALGRNRPRA